MRIVGPVHGFAFVAYLWSVWQTGTVAHWRNADLARLIISAFVPLGAKRGVVEYWRSRGWPELCQPLDADDFHLQVNGKPSILASDAVQAGPDHRRRPLGVAFLELQRSSGRAPHISSWSVVDLTAPGGDYDPPGFADRLCPRHCGLRRFGLLDELAEAAKR